MELITEFGDSKERSNAIALYPDRVVLTFEDHVSDFKRKFVPGYKGFPIGVVTIPFDSITSIEFVPLDANNTEHNLFGMICFNVPGNSNSRDHQFWFVDNAQEKANALYKKALEYKNAAIQQQQQNASQAAAQQVVTVQQPSPADEILKFKYLYDQGIISLDDYEAKKRQLLAL